MNLEIPHVRHGNPAPMFADAVGLAQLLLRRDAAGTSPDDTRKPRQGFFS